MQKEQLVIIGGILGTLVIIVIGAIIYNNNQFGGDPASLFTHGRSVHWHAQMTATVCGQEMKMPVAQPGGQVGYGPIHTHDDALVHMEGIFNKPTDIGVKKYLTSVNIPFSDKGIFNKTDGSPCTNQPNQATISATGAGQRIGHLHGTVNGKEVPDILNYRMHDPNNTVDEQDKIHLIYD